ncbi:MAG: hypothetical protein MI810_23830 [Flavobacteriales bacterium]|nr:hypothetical protein [Flavobacteriales bacterium]
MKNTKNLSVTLLIIGVLGTFAAIWGMFKGEEMANQIPFIVCSLSLILSAFIERDKKTSDE